MNYHKDNGLLNMIRRTDPKIIRKEEKRPMRTTYGKHPVPQKYLNQQ
jgi:hypothetical protein